MDTGFYRPFINAGDGLMRHNKAMYGNGLLRTDPNRYITRLNKATVRPTTARQTTQHTTQHTTQQTNTHAR